MSTTSKITVGATEYDLRDADAQEQLTQLKSDFDALEEAVTITEQEHTNETVSATWTDGYINDQGQVNTNSNYKHTNQFAVTPGDIINVIKDADSIALSSALYVTVYANGSAVTALGGYNKPLPFTVPATAEYLVISFNKNVGDVSIIKTATTDILVNSEKPNTDTLFDIVANGKKNSLEYSFDLIANTAYTGADELQDICGYRICFDAKFSGTFSGLVRIGKAETQTYGGAIGFDDTNIYSYISGNVSTPSRTEAHGLTLKDYVSLIIDYNYNGTANVILATNGGIKTWLCGYWRSQYGVITAISTEIALSDCHLSYYCAALDTETWLYGDSYFSNTGTIRWTGYLISNGYTNFLLNGYPGRNSAIALASLKKDLSFNRIPRRIVWCLGMNDADANSQPSANWLSALTELETICEKYHIELILATIPNVSASGYSNAYKNAFVKESGYRYIDFADAISADGSSTWYDGMLEDGVHPTAAGAVALFARAITDVPELLQ